MTDTRSLQEVAAAAVASQVNFEACFDHKPKVDTSTPAQVKARALREGWK